MGWKRLDHKEFETGSTEGKPVTKEELIEDIKQSYKPPYSDVFLRLIEQGDNQARTRNAFYWFESED
jgi:hypothetical protein